MVAFLLPQAPQGSRGQILEWIKQLGSDDVGVRESASQSLLDQGLNALEVLKRLPESPDREVRARLDAIIHQVVKATVESHWRKCLATPVTLELENALIQTVMEALRKQSPLKIAFDDSNFPEDYRLENVKLAGVPLREALDVLMKRTEMAVVRKSPAGIWIARPPRLTFAFRQASFSVVAEMVSRVTGVKIERERGAAGRIDYSCTNAIWTDVIDEVSALIRCVAVRTAERRLVIRTREEFRKSLKTRTFPLKHLRLEASTGIGPSRMEVLLRTLDSMVTRGAAWGTVHGKVRYDIRQSAIVITDRAEVLSEAGREIARFDRPTEPK